MRKTTGSIGEFTYELLLEKNQTCMGHIGLIRLWNNTDYARIKKPIKMITFGKTYEEIYRDMKKAIRFRERIRGLR